MLILLMVKLKNISIYFKSDCCNDNKKDIENQEPNNGMGSLLVEPIPGRLERFFAWMKKHHKLDLQEICVTFKPKYHNMNMTMLHTKFKKTIQSYMAKYDYFKPVYLFIPEFNKSGMLHYHGVVYFDNANDYWTADLKRKLNSLYGRTEGKKIYNIENYINYIKKDIEKQKFTIKPFCSIHEELQGASEENA